MRNVFLLVCIFLFLFQQTAFSKPTESKIENRLVQKLDIKKTSQSSKKLENQKNGGLSKKDKSKRDKTKSNCDLSGRSQKEIKSYVVSSADDFLQKEDIENLLDMHLEDIEKGWPNKCPKHCQAINNYSIFGKAYPLNVSKNSCDKKEAKEVYQLSKKIPMGGSGKADKQKAYKKTRDWMLSVFVNPFYPFAKKPPKEFIENNLGKSCPSCSFYLDYTYRYTSGNQLDLKVTARCSDKRTFFSKIKSEFFLVNHWKCD